MPRRKSLLGSNDSPGIKKLALCSMHLSAVVSIVAMWLVVRSRWLHDLFSGGAPYNWLLGSIGLAAVVGMAIKTLL